MSVENFIPEIWSGNIMANFHNDTVVTALANRKYEGELTPGAVIHIPGIVDIKTKDYKAGTILGPRTTKPDMVASTTIDLTVDQERSFDFLVDDIDRVQAKNDLGVYTQSAATALVEDAETFLTAQLLTGGTVVSGLSDPTDWKSAHGVVAGLRAALSKQTVPFTNRYLLVNPKFAGLLLGADSPLIKVNESGDTQALREATLGRLLGFQVVENPWMTEEKAQAIAFWPEALAYVSQITKTEGMRDTDRFGDRIRGLHVYGGAVLRPTAVQVFTAKA